MTDPGDHVGAESPRSAEGRIAVAVVIVTRNRVAQLAETVARHLALPERPRVVVIDDASVDGTSSTIRARFPAVRLISLRSSRGAVARNIGLTEVDEPYVAFADDDAWFTPGALGQAAALLDRHPRLAVVNPRILVGAAERLDPVCAEMARTPLPAADGQPGQPLLGFLACAVVVRRRAALEVGGFCERLEVGGEERLLSWDLATAGWQLSYFDDLVAHHCPPPRATRSARRVKTLRNDLWVTWLRRPVASAARATVRELRRSGAHRSTARAATEAAAGAGWVLRARKRCPPRVEQMIALLEQSPSPGNPDAPARGGTGPPRAGSPADLLRP